MIRGVARVLGMVSIIWLLAAVSTAAFVPRGPGINAQDQITILSASIGGAILVIAIGVAVCGALAYMLTHSLTGPLLLSCAGLIALALVLPRGLTPFFLPPPIGLLLSAWLLMAFPDPNGNGTP